MKRSLRTFPCLLLVAACAGAPDYVFRDAERPAYERNLSVDELHSARDGDDYLVLDVRLEEDYAANPVLIPGALYRNPESIDEWSSGLPRDATIVVYCVKGRWVSQKAAAYLDEQGFNVYSLDGGIEAWQAGER